MKSLTCSLLRDFKHKEHHDLSGTPTLSYSRELLNYQQGRPSTHRFFHNLSSIQNSSPISTPHTPTKEDLLRVLRGKNYNLEDKQTHKSSRMNRVKKKSNPTTNSTLSQKSPKPSKLTKSNPLRKNKTLTTKIDNL
jgi:hypothetical protein